MRAAPAHTLQDLASSADTDPEQLCRELSGLTARGRCGQLLADAVQTSKAPKAASHGLCPPWARRLVTGDAGGVRLNPNLSRSDARLLGIRGIAYTRRKAGGDPGSRVDASGRDDCPLAVLWRLCSDKDPLARLNAASDLIGASDSSAEHRLARHTYEQLASLAGNAHDMVRYCVAMDPACPPQVLQRLVTDTDPAVQEAAVRNRRMTDDLLRPFAQHSDIHIRLLIAGSDAVSGDTFAVLAQDKAESAREATAKNENCPPGVLAALAEDIDRSVRIGVAHNANCPPEVLAKLAADDAERVRYAVVCHPNSSADTLAVLAADPPCPPSLLKRRTLYNTDL